MSTDNATETPQPLIAVGAQVDRGVRPAVWNRGVLAELQDAAARKWQGDPAAQGAGLFARAAAEIERQQREREVFARWMAEACGVLFSVEEEAEDGGESLRMLRERGLRLVRAILGPPPLETEPNGPQCNLNTPWLAP